MILALTLTAGFGLVLSSLGVLLVWDGHRTLMKAYTALEDRVHYLEIAQSVRDRAMWGPETQGKIDAEVAYARERQRPSS